MTDRVPSGTRHTPHELRQNRTVGEFEKMILSAVPSIEALIPADPAAELGRYESKRLKERGTPVQQSLSRMNDLLVERLLGALELHVARLDLRAPGELVAHLRQPEHSYFLSGTGGRESATRKPVHMLEILHPGATELITERVRELLPLDLSDASGDEAAIAARHGAAHLAVAVAVATAVLRAIGTEFSTDPAAIIGVAIGVTALLLPSIPMPPAYEQALLEKRRKDYQFGYMHSHVPVFDHEFLLVEELSLTKADFTANGLTGAVDTGFAVRTGVAEGHVPVSLRVLPDPPEEVDLDHWDEVVEISYTAVAGGARLGRAETPPWPGEFRVRVHARGRDEEDENYALVIWSAPFAEPLVHKKTDRVGHLLRGEPAPEVVPAPDAEHRWLEKELVNAATVTIVTGLTAAEVEPEFEGDFIVVETEDAVIVVENNHYVGSRGEVLERLSRKGKAASHYWNVNRNTRLSFARDGQVIASEHTDGGVDFGDDPEVAAAVDGFDWDDWRYTDAKGITAVTRFTGRTIPRDVVLAKLQEMLSNY